MGEHAVDLEAWEEYDANRGSFVHHMIAGSIAGVAEHVAMFPVDTYKTRVQFLRGSASRGLTFWSMVRADGFVRMWRGASAVLAVTLPSHAAYFATYELVKERLGVNEAGHHPLAAAAVGASATTLHDAVLTPMDVVKQRLQLGYYRGVGHCVRTMLKTEGLRAFYRSYPTTVVMNMPYAAAIVSANESMKKVLIPEGTAPSPYAFFLAAGVAGAFAAAVTCPLDVVKT